MVCAPWHLLDAGLPAPTVPAVCVCRATTRSLRMATREQPPLTASRQKPTLQRRPSAAKNKSAVAVQLLSRVHLFTTPWTTACQASLSCTISQSLLRLMSVESVMPSNCLILCCPASSCLESFPASGSFLMSRFFASGGQSIGDSASVLPMIIQD